MNVNFAKQIAKYKGYVFEFDERENIYVLMDSKRSVIMQYAPITLSLITEQDWRKELNLLNFNSKK